MKTIPSRLVSTGRSTTFGVCAKTWRRQVTVSGLTGQRVLVHAYEEYGTKCWGGFQACRLCNLDKARQSLFVARDHLGVKPLTTTGMAVFSYRLRAQGDSAPSAVKRDIDLDGARSLCSNANTFPPDPGERSSGAAVTLVLQHEEYSCALKPLTAVPDVLHSR